MATAMLKVWSAPFFFKVVDFHPSSAAFHCPACASLFAGRRSLSQASMTLTGSNVAVYRRLICAAIRSIMLFSMLPTLSTDPAPRLDSPATESSILFL